MTLTAILAVWLLVCLSVGAGQARAETTPPVPMHPDLPDTLDATAIARFGLFPDVPGIKAVYFIEAPWGGFLARIAVIHGREQVVYERNVPLSRWRELQHRAELILAGGNVEPLPDPVPRDPDTSPDPETTRIRTWPEVSLPPALARPVPEGASTSLEATIDGRWVAMLEFGYRHNITDFNEYYTDMGAIGVAFGRGIGENLIPHFGIEIGFGDIQSEFESIAGDGRANAYGFVLGVLGKQSLGRRSHAYLSGAGGYFIRSLQWGDPYAYSYYYNSNVVLEQQDWGYEIRAGLLLDKSGTGKPRFWDLSLAVQTTPAETWEHYSGDRYFSAGGRDTWVTISIRLWDGI